jgi:retron-type reverse transcriptase
MGNGLSFLDNNLRILALAILGGHWDKHHLSERLERSLDGGPPEPGRLASRLLFHFDDQPPSRQRLLEFLRGEAELRRRFALQGASQGPKPLLDPPVMGRPPAPLVTFPLPPLATLKDLQLWLALSEQELDWFADVERRQCRVTRSRLHHYRYHWIDKRTGSPRLIEIPKNRLKTIQCRILKEILQRVPPHRDSHGFSRGRSTLSFVEQHLGKSVVLRMDLKDFFHRVPVPRIGALFRRLGYPGAVARQLQGLCTHAASPTLAGGRFRTLSWERRKCLTDKHLPQGAPTSPALANLCAWRLDCRLRGLADRFGLDYGRYADDLAFSGSRELLRLAPHLQALIGAIAMEEGFAINHRKTRVRTQAQSQRLAGMLVNQKPNLPRAEFDRLKATLYNCVQRGPQSQNLLGHKDFKAHLAGRIAYVNWLNPAKGRKLLGLWEQIPWHERL